MAFSDRVWWTRKAKIQTEKRLLSNAFQSQILLLWYSFLSVSSAIYYLKNGATSNTPEISAIAWVVFSVLTLSISGFINGLSFKERANLIKECYETLNGLYQKTKVEQTDQGRLTQEYEQILGLCENHSDKDYYTALCVEYVSTHGKPNKETGLKKDLDRSPTWYHWYSLAYWKIGRLLLLVTLYTLPVAIFIALECFE